MENHPHEIPDKPAWLSSLDKAIPVRIGVAGAAVTTMAVGGPLEALAEPRDLRELTELRRVCAAQNTPMQILGAGSNLLISDQGAAGCTVCLGRGFAEITALDGHRIEVGGAVSLMVLARRMSRAGLSGLEFAAGIPASVGGALWMNAGAHGGEICERVEAITVLLLDGTLVELSSSQLTPEYRSMRLPAGAIVVGARLALVAGDATKSEAVLARLLAERRRTQPLQLPSAGSIFRNPDPSKGIFAGALLEACGLKGAAQGEALISELHANWIVNPNRRATCTEVDSLIRRAQDAVQDRFGVALETEVRRLGACLI